MIVDVFRDPVLAVRKGREKERQKRVRFAKKIITAHYYCIYRSVLSREGILMIFNHRRKRREFVGDQPRLYERVVVQDLLRLRHVGCLYNGDPAYISPFARLRDSPPCDLLLEPLNMPGNYLAEPGMISIRPYFIYFQKIHSSLLCSCLHRSICSETFPPASLQRRIIETSIRSSICSADPGTHQSTAVPFP